MAWCFTSLATRIYFFAYLCFLSFRPKPMVGAELWVNIRRKPKRNNILNQSSLVEHETLSKVHLMNFFHPFTYTSNEQKVSLPKMTCVSHYNHQTNWSTIFMQTWNINMLKLITLVKHYWFTRMHLAVKTFSYYWWILEQLPYLNFVVNLEHSWTLELYIYIYIYLILQHIDIFMDIIKWTSNQIQFSCHLITYYKWHPRSIKRQVSICDISFIQIMNVTI